MKKRQVKYVKQKVSASKGSEVSGVSKTSKKKVKSIQTFNAQQIKKTIEKK